MAGSGPNFPNFTAEENEGKQLFLKIIPNGGGACFGCLTTEAFISANPGPQNNGLDLVTTDPGAGETFPNNPIFDARLKTSSLRNIELTATYMHDGRFATLEEVVDYYNSGIQAHPTLSAALTDDNGDLVQLNFTDTHKSTLVAFMKALTDFTLVSDVRFSNPFNSKFTFQGNVDSNYFVNYNWDAGILPPIGFGGSITIDTDCIMQDTLPFDMLDCSELIITNNLIFTIK